MSGAFMRTDPLSPTDFAAAPPLTSHALPVEGRRALQFLATWVLSTVPALLAPSHQYTWSLLMFIGPLVVLAPELKDPELRRALVRAALALVPMGVLLTVCFADDFFTYRNPAATLGITVSALDLSGIDRSAHVPIEEYAFYLFGFLAVLVIYAWADRVLVPRVRAFVPVELNPAAALAGAGTGLGLALLGIAFHAATRRVGFPGYWVYLMVVPVPVVVGLWPTVRARINWVALGVTCLALWGHSIVWEISLAIPQGWWGYQPDAMLGLTLHAWGDFPLEGVLVWLLTPFATVMAFEFARSLEARAR